MTKEYIYIKDLDMYGYCMNSDLDVFDCIGQSKDVSATYDEKFSCFGTDGNFIHLAEYITSNPDNYNSISKYLFSLHIEDELKDLLFYSIVEGFITSKLSIDNIINIPIHKVNKNLPDAPKRIKFYMWHGRHYAYN